MIAHKRLPRHVSITVPPTPAVVVSPSDPITTLSGAATVTRTEQVGTETIVWADYGSGESQPHTGEDLSAVAVGTVYYCKKSGLPYQLVRANAEEACLNWDDGKQCTSTRLSWKEVSRLFSPLPPDETLSASAKHPAGKTDSRSRPSQPRHSNRSASKSSASASANHPANVLSLAGSRLAEIESPHPPEAAVVAEREQAVSSDNRQLEIIGAAPESITKPKFQKGDRVRIIELAGRNRKWLHAKAEVVELSPHCQIKVWDEEFQKYHQFHWNPEWLELITLPLEQESLRAEATHEAIARLEQERDTIKAEGAIAPQGCWIETGKVKGRNFRQAWWRSTQPMFTPKRSRGNAEAKTKTSYIGEEGSPEHKEAIAQKQRRDRLKHIEKQIQILQEECDRG